MIVFCFLKLPYPYLHNFNISLLLSFTSIQADIKLKTQNLLIFEQVHLVWWDICAFKNPAKGQFGKFVKATEARLEKFHFQQ